MPHLLYYFIVFYITFFAPLLNYFIIFDEPVVGREALLPNNQMVGLEVELRMDGCSKYIRTFWGWGWGWGWFMQDGCSEHFDT